MPKPVEIVYVVEARGWVQHARAAYLQQHQDRFRFRVVPLNRFRWLWKLGLFRHRPIMFSSWRSMHGLLKRDAAMFSEANFGHFLGAVTSHSTIGGGLDPLNPIPGRTAEEAMELALGILKRFKVVTANSMILYELLKPHLPGVMYCPNGVDADFFTPGDPPRPRDAGGNRIGWVGKERGPKNLEAIDAAFGTLSGDDRIEPRLVRLGKGFRKAPFDARQMREFYRSIDYYLCASWNEGTPNPALEAAACGVPVMTTCVGNMRELIHHGETGWFIEPTAESIVSRCRAVAETGEAEYRAMSRAIRRAIETDWTWPRRIGGFTNALEALVA